MKPKYFNLGQLEPMEGEVFKVGHHLLPQFYPDWHHHPELQLMYIIKGAGTQLVGYEVKPLYEGQLVLVGADLPHLWKADKSCENERVEYIFLMFKSDFLGTYFFDLKELTYIKSVFEQAQRGLVILGEARLSIIEHLQKVLLASGIERIARILEILHLIAVADEKLFLLPTPFVEKFEALDSDRLSKIYAYSIKHFQKKISLNEIAAVANLSPHSFCRYFKTHTLKTYAHFLLELRINHSQKLLMNTDSPISLICFESGFNNFTNFNKFFKQFTGLTPKEYRVSKKVKLSD